MIVIDKVCPQRLPASGHVDRNYVGVSAMKSVPSGRDRANTLRKGINDAIDTLAKAVDSVA